MGLRFTAQAFLELFFLFFFFGGGGGVNDYKYGGVEETCSENTSDCKLIKRIERAVSLANHNR